MTTRALAAVIVLLALLVAASTMIPALAPWRWHIMIFGAVVAGGCLVSLFFFTRRHTARMASFEAKAETDFELAVLREVQSPPKKAAPVNSKAGQQPPPIATVLRAPQTAASAPSGAPGTGVEGLLTQLRMARLEPSIEGRIQQGPFEGATIVRLGREGTALILPRVPSAEDWGGLFPRYDRVFIQRADGRWITAERLESLMSQRIDLRL